jgi:hypothetical protein
LAGEAKRLSKYSPAGPDPDDLGLRVRDEFISLYRKPEKKTRIEVMPMEKRSKGLKRNEITGRNRESLVQAAFARI